MTVIEASAAARAAGRRHASTPVRRLPRLPYFVSRVFFVAAVLLLAQALLPALLWLGPLVDSYSTLFVPIDSGSIALAAFMLILGAGLARRKRAAWLITVVWFGFLLLVDLFTVAVLVLLVFAGQIDFPDLPTLARFGFNLASLGTLFAFLVVYRGEFTARRPPGSIRRALITLLVGCLITFGVGVLLVSVFPGGLVRPTGRIAWMARRIGVGLVGGNTAALTSPISAPPGWINTVISILIALTLLASALALLRSQRRAALVTPADEPKIRALVAQSPDDSLAYFATRRDKSVVFAPDGSSAVMYRVDLGVCLASSDPIGARDHWDRAISAWLVLVRTYGWTPAVLGASEAGATAYARAGMQVIRLGDEAILAAAEFHLDAHDMRPVRQAVTRLERMGYGTRIRRHRDIGPAEFAALIAHTDAWRDTEAERGFSMALGRLGDPADGDCLMVEATFPPDRREAGPAGDVAAILSLVPWGSDGYSLDVMRRHPGADNGVNELMVTRLMAAGRDFGYRRVSLNFAVFRSAFEEGARIGAGPVLRLWRRLLLVASRWWQIESLFRSNVKYRPEWQPRFLCFEETRDIALVGAASGVAEGFIDLPNFLRRPGQEAARPLPVDGPVPVPAIPAAPVTAPRVPEQTRLRLQIREHILASGGDPYPVTFRPSRGCASLRLGGRASVAGRVIAVRDFGGVVFVQIRDWTGDAQLILTRAETGGRALADFRRLVDLGDQLGATGSGVLSRSGELSLQVADWVLTAKSLRPPPDKHRGLTDPEARVRQRYLDLAVNPAARTQLSARSRAVRAVRDTLDARGFLEVETPILQTVHGGANARPFRTHINAYDLDLYLRIAPELYLKRLLVGGVDRVFEIGRNFRNEGADATHNPEFTMLEAYEAYGDYATMQTIAFDLVTSAARAAIGGTLIRGQDSHGACQEVDLAEPWRVVPVNEAVSAASGEEITADTGRERLARLAERLGIVIDDRWSRGAVLLELYEHLVEHRTLAPTFYTDFPAEVSPLTRAHRVDPRLAERWDLVAFGAEIGTAYSELVDPVEQRARLTAQSLLAAGGDPEAMELDEDFLDALEYAMPPSGGLGMGLDRLVMLLTNATIRDTVTFPLVRPRRRG